MFEQRIGMIESKARTCSSASEIFLERRCNVEHISKSYRLRFYERESGYYSSRSTKARVRARPPRGPRIEACGPNEVRNVWTGARGRNPQFATCG